jgi:hypothetical protein
MEKAQTEKPKFLATNPLSLLCPKCMSMPGRVCIASSGRTSAPHAARIKSATMVDKEKQSKIARMAANGIVTSVGSRSTHGEEATPSEENTMEMKRVDAMEMNCVICGERTEQVYDLHLPGDKVVVARLGVCDNDKAVLEGLPSEERNAKLIEAMRRANLKRRSHNA